MSMIETPSQEKKALQKLAGIGRLKKRLIAFGLAAAFLLLILGGAWVVGRKQAKAKYEDTVAELLQKIEEQDKRIQELIENPIVVSSVSPEIRLDVIASEIQEIGELATVEYLFTDAARFSDSKQIKNWNIPFTEKSFTIKWDGVIKAGIQVDEIVLELEESETGKKIIVTLPAAQILSYDVDEKNVEVLDEKDNIFNNISINDKVKLDESTEEAMKKRAIENGILEDAQVNAENIITALLLSNPDIAGNCSIEFKHK